MLKPKKENRQGMTPGVGMTHKEARDLIDSGYSWIRHNDIESKTHWGSGVLLDVEGDYGLVKPANRHRQTEYVSLSSMKPWKSRNEGLALRDGIVAKEEAMQYVIVDLEDGLIWSGRKMGFIKAMEHAIVYETPHKANMGIGGLKRSIRFQYYAERASVVTLDEANEAILDSQLLIPSVEKTVEPKSVEPKVIVREVPKRAVRVNEVPVRSSDREVDLEMDEYRRAMSDLEEAHLLIMDAKERADKSVARMAALLSKRSQQAFMATT